MEEKKGHACCMLPPVPDCFSRFVVYQCPTRLYVIASNAPRNDTYRVLKFNRSSVFTLDVEFDAGTYDQDGVESLVSMLHAVYGGSGAASGAAGAHGSALSDINGKSKNNSSDNSEERASTSRQRQQPVLASAFERIATARAILGCIRFVHGYYLHIVTDARQVGTFGGHVVWAIEATTLVPISSVSALEAQLPPAYVDDLMKDTAGLRPEVVMSRRKAMYKRLRALDARYKSLFLVTDMSRNFYYSHSLDLTHRMQDLFSPQCGPPKEMHLWNSFLRRPLVRALRKSMLRWEDDPPKCAAGKSGSDAAGAAALQLLDCQDGEEEDHSRVIDGNGTGCPDGHNLGADVAAQESSFRQMQEATSIWLVTCIHGFFEQVQCCTFGRILTLTLVARRSRYFAGTRYLKRGLNDAGFVANDVETEQILHDRAGGGSPFDGNYTSYVQMRASIPLFWAQESNAMIARPAIVMQKVDPMHLTTRKHFENLLSRYGSPLLALNLVRQAERRPRESIIGEAFGDSVAFINQFLPDEHKIDYHAWDFKMVAKSKTVSVVDELAIVSDWALQRTGIFHSAPNTDAVEALPEKTYKLKPQLSHFTGRSAVESQQRAYDRASIVSGYAGDDCTPGPKDIPRMASFSSSLNEPHRIQKDQVRTSVSLTPFVREFGGDDEHSKSLGDCPAFCAIDMSPPKGIRPNSAYTATSNPVDIGVVQRGVLRSNCIDSLDRTNVAQFCVGKCALGYQLYALRLTDAPEAESTSEMVNILLDLYEHMGDALSLQYGGSHMHRAMNKDKSESRTLAPALRKKSTYGVGRVSHAPKEMFVSLVRHYQNSFQDTSKQDAMNLLMGHFVPVADPNALTIWDLGTDYYLHNVTVEHTYGALGHCVYDDPSWWKSRIDRYEAKLAVLGGHRRGEACTTLPGKTNGNADESKAVIARHALDRTSDASFDSLYHPQRLSSFDMVLKDPVLKVHDICINPKVNNQVERNRGSAQREMLSHCEDSDAFIQARRIVDGSVAPVERPMRSEYRIAVPDGVVSSLDVDVVLASTFEKYVQIYFRDMIISDVNVIKKTRMLESDVKRAHEIATDFEVHELIASGSSFPSHARHVNICDHVVENQPSMTFQDRTLHVVDGDRLDDATPFSNNTKSRTAHRTAAPEVWHRLDPSSPMLSVSMSSPSAGLHGEHFGSGTPGGTGIGGDVLSGVANLLERAGGDPSNSAVSSDGSVVPEDKDGEAELQHCLFVHHVVSGSLDDASMRHNFLGAAPTNSALDAVLPLRAALKPSDVHVYESYIQQFRAPEVL